MTYEWPNIELAIYIHNLCTHLYTAAFILSEKNSQTAGSESLCSRGGMPSISGISLSEPFTTMIIFCMQMGT